MFHSRANCTDIDVGEVREATMGQPMRAALLIISDEMRPVQSRILSRGSIFSIKHAPRN